MRLRNSGSTVRAEAVARCDIGAVVLSGALAVQTGGHAGAIQQASRGITKVKDRAGREQVSSPQPPHALL
jgi:hypothetical protein